MMVAMLGMGVSAAVDIDLFGLVATVILAISWFPLGIHLITGAGATAPTSEHAPQLA
jgi:hypothetical protein